MKAEIRSDKIAQYTCFLYFIFPISLFFFGWIKPIFAWLFFLIILFGLYTSLRDHQFKSITINYKSVGLFLGLNGVFILWLYFSGIAGFSLQNWDFHGRNALFHDLINYPWPVRYHYGSQPDLQGIFGTNGVLVYYFSYFLPAALIGKIFGWNAANFFLFFWSLLGLNLFFYRVFRYLQKSHILMVFVVLLFSGMDILVSHHLIDTPTTALPTSFFASVLNPIHIDNWAVGYFQYSSMTTQLYYVFNQSLPTWIITVWLLGLKNRKNLVFIFSLLLFFAPLPFIGLFPFFIFKFFNLPLQENKRIGLKSFFSDFYKRYKDVFTFQNCISAPLILLIAYLFFSVTAGNHVNGFISEFHSDIPQLLLVTFVFYFIEFLFLGLLLFPFTPEKFLLSLAIGCLLIIPVFRYGIWNDFAMRVSIPSLLVLNILTLKFLFTQKNLPVFGKIMKFIIILLLFIGGFTPLHELYRPIQAAFHSPTVLLMDSWKTFGCGGYIDKMENIRNFVVSDNGTSPFFHYLAKSDSSW